MAEPQFPLFDAVGRGTAPAPVERAPLLRLVAYAVQVGSVSLGVWLSATSLLTDTERWVALAFCGLLAVASGSLLVWPLARAVAEAVAARAERFSSRPLWVAHTPSPAVEGHAKAPHLRLVWSRRRDEKVA